MKKKKNRALRIVLFTVLVLVLLAVSIQVLHNVGPQKEAKSDLEFIFVHGLSGWGSYDRQYKYMPYWGMMGGDLVGYLNREGYESYAASVAPTGSAWDRACELYAQLAGVVTDYGAEHSARCGHERFGPDFRGRALVPDWEDGRQIVLLGHSFGGATVRLFSQLMADGSPAEQAAAAEDISPLFAGGQEGRIFAIVTLAAPTNGTTAYDLHQDPNFDPSAVKVPAWDDKMGNIFSNRPQPERDGRIEDDYAAYDMVIDHAQALNHTIRTLSGCYYFAVPCSATEMNAEGNQVPIRARMEGMFRRSSAQMGAYSGVTAGGVQLGDDWKENDGLVNTISAKAPFGEPWAEYTGESVQPGIWNIMPTVQGDHMSLQGGMTKHVNVRPYYLDLLWRISLLKAA